MSDREALRELGRLMTDPWWFIPRLRVTTKRGRVIPFDLHDEQTELLAALLASRQVLVLKPRQIGCTTLVMAYLLWRVLVAGQKLDVLSITHEGGALGRINLMLRDFHRNLPPQLRAVFPIGKQNGHEFELRLGTKDEAPTSMFRQTMAGGRGQGRSFTYQALHGTEVGFWPVGSAAMASSEADEATWASALSVIDDEAPVIVESTANGPSGLFYNLYQTATQSDDWAVLFFSWAQFKAYTKKPPPGFTPTKDEARLAELHGLTDAQLYWRRLKIEAMNGNVSLFRKEFPLTALEPFLATGSRWFNVERLNAYLAQLRPMARQGWRVFEAYDRNRKYYLGVDPGGGVGLDRSVLHVVRDDAMVTAVFSCDDQHPSAFAEVVAGASAEWGKARVLCEDNKYGATVNKRLRELRIPLWMAPRVIGGEPKVWWTDERTKATLLDYARLMIDNGYADIRDQVTVQECMHVREFPDGRIEGDEGWHDDHAMSLALALYNARVRTTTETTPDRDIMRARERRHRELGLKRGH